METYKLELIKIYEKSQDSFEKQLSYLSAGALGLSILFIEKTVTDISTSTFKFFLAGSWILLAITLVVNLISHSISARNSYKTINDIETDKYDSEKAEKRIKQVNKINNLTITTFLLGILALIIFVIINTMSDKIKTSNNSDLTKGFTSGPPPNSYPAPAPQTGQNPTPPPSIPSKPIEAPKEK
ncbi:MAG: hypothetical protein ABI390_02310 [Daejeonella sp.]